ncbi:hypothetical protein AAFX24_07925 [Vibrio mediterranei]|uniref:hypothetical protein n=1 Tax=Vibrio mediterranei TaxID=689 RepID=UPI0038CE93A1
MSTSPSQLIQFRAPNELANKIKAKNNFSDWLRMAAIERLERERLERLAESSKRQKD